MSNSEWAKPQAHTFIQQIKTRCQKLNENELKQHTKKKKKTHTHTKKPQSQNVNNYTAIEANYYFT